jgi:NAD(P)H dehydrogenase (quinone)
MTTKVIRSVLVHGANGAQGGAIARQLQAEGFAVRAAVRDVSKARALAAAGIEVVSADLESRAQVLEACEAMDAAVLTLPLCYDRSTILRWTENATSAASAAGVGLMILNTSGRIPAERTEIAGFELRREAETMVRTLGPPTTILRPPFYMENLAGPWITGAMAASQVVAYPVALRLRAAWLALADLGAYVAAALRRPDLAGEIRDIGGPQVLDGSGLVRDLSPAFGHPLTYVAVPPDVFERNLAPHLGSAVAKEIAASYFWLAAHADTSLLMGTDPQLQDELARPATSLARWARAQVWPALAAKTA